MGFTRAAPPAVLRAVRALLRSIGEDPDRPGLRDTPRRFWTALREMAGNCGDEGAKEILSSKFGARRYGGILIIRNIEFTSVCEHHLLPFQGVVDIAYLPDGHVVGLSKLARLVDLYSRRLQLQEYMTQQIAEAIEEHLKPRAVVVVAKAEHSCMSCRGVRKRDALTVTSSVLGEALDSAPLRAEFFALLGMR